MADVHEEAVNALASYGFITGKGAKDSKFLDFIETRLGVPPGDKRAEAIYKEALRPRTLEEAEGVVVDMANKHMEVYRSWSRSRFKKEL